MTHAAHAPNAISKKRRAASGQIHTLVQSSLAHARIYRRIRLRVHTSDVYTRPSHGDDAKGERTLVCRPFHCCGPSLRRRTSNSRGRALRRILASSCRCQPVHAIVRRNSTGWCHISYGSLPRECTAHQHICHSTNKGARYESAQWCHSRLLILLLLSLKVVAHEESAMPCQQALRQKGCTKQSPDQCCRHASIVVQGQNPVTLDAPQNKCSSIQ